MTQLLFVDAHAPEWSDKARALTVEYFQWMNQQIVQTCHFSIEDIVGMPLLNYVDTACDTICPKDPTRSRFYLLVVGADALAMGGIRSLPDGSAEIVRVFTHPLSRGRGYGAAILSRLITDAKQLGYQTLKLDTGNFMNSAHALYESFGFKDCAPYDGAEPPLALMPYWRFMECSLIPRSPKEHHGNK